MKRSRVCQSRWRRGAGTGLLLSLLLAGAFGAPRLRAAAEPAAPPAAEALPRAALIRFEGEITPLLEQFLYRKLQVAEDDGVEVVIIEIDSPGGMLKSSFDVAHRLRDLTWARTVAFVPQQAISGAAIVALGCDEIVMAPNAVLGDAGPIMQGEDSLFRHVPEKVLSLIVPEIRDLATAKRRAPALAEAMVDRNLVVYQVTNRQTGEKTYRSDAELKSSDRPDDWQKGPPVLESGNGRFLAVSGQRAVELRLAGAQARNRAELTRLLKVDEKLLVLESGAVDTAVALLNLPLITGLLFVIGLVALYIELHAPGIGIGGLVAALCFALFFWSRFLGGTAEVLEVILFLVGVGFLAIEVFVLPGFGFAGITGIALMLVSVVMACQGFAIPTTGRQLETFSTNLLVIACSGAAFLATAAWLRRYLGRLPLLNRLALQPAPAQVAEVSAPGQAPAAASQAAPLRLDPLLLLISGMLMIGAALVIAGNLLKRRG